LDKHGMVLNMAQTWHQLRPGEGRYDCGGSHAHSKRPTPFGDTAANRPGYAAVDGVTHTPWWTARRHDHSGKQGDGQDEPGGRSGWGEGLRKSRYVWAFQSRRSLLIWKIFGARLDGFSNDDHPMEAVPGDPATLQFKGQPFKPTPQDRSRPDVGYTGSIMPPP